MNDNDIDLITSLIGGELSKPEEADAFARIGSDPELRAAYDEQLAITSMLGSTPAVAMTPGETATMHAALRTELRLGETTVAVAATATGWSRWWVPLTGLATAAVVIFAIAVLPGALDGTDSEEVLSAQLAETTAPASELETLDDGEALRMEGDEGAEEATPSTTTAATESADSAALEGTASDSEYFLSPQAARQSELELPIVEDDALASDGLVSAAASSFEYSSVNFGALFACFAAATVGSELAPVGVTPDLSAVYAIATDIETGIETSVTIDLSTCQVTETG